jgi:hypothetical protein
MKLLLAILLLAVPMGAQTVATPPPPAPPQTVLIPGVDGITICQTSGVISLCANPVVTGNLTVNGALILKGGTALPDGQFIAQMTGGVLTLIPYTAPAGKTYSVALPTTNGTSYTLVSGVTLASGQQATVVPISTHTGPPLVGDWSYYSHPFIYVDTAGAIYVGLPNATSKAITGAQVTVTVK